MTKKKIADTLTQQFQAATVTGPTDSAPSLTVTDDVEVYDDDPTLVMPRNEIEILRQVCGK